MVNTKNSSDDKILLFCPCKPFLHSEYLFYCAEMAIFPFSGLTKDFKSDKASTNTHQTYAHNKNIKTHRDLKVSQFCAVTTQKWLYLLKTVLQKKLLYTIALLG